MRLQPVKVRNIAIEDDSQILELLYAGRQEELKPGGKHGRCLAFHTRSDIQLRKG